MHQEEKTFVVSKILQSQYAYMHASLQHKPTMANPVPFTTKLTLTMAPSIHAYWKYTRNINSLNLKKAWKSVTFFYNFTYSKKIYMYKVEWTIVESSNESIWTLCIKQGKTKCQNFEFPVFLFIFITHNPMNKICMNFLFINWMLYLRKFGFWFKPASIMTTRFMIPNIQHNVSLWNHAPFTFQGCMESLKLALFSMGIWERYKSYNALKEKVSNLHDASKQANSFAAVDKHH